ncbi:MAG: DNA-binding protein [Myxococcales bacterium]|nr:DNA-binding protein [Myxococcales bacterium]USN51911.1 MAG: DNA-binding protein [Myxococcales bacterium]
MAREHRKMRSLGELENVNNLVHPTSRSQCVNMPRPCLYVSCRHHLYLDVNEETGSVKFNFPDKEVWELEETCALDVADRGGITLEEVGCIMNLTRERIRQLELSGLEKLKHHARGEDNLETYARWDPSFDENSSCN